jgi:uncharacterized membrane protein
MKSTRRRSDCVLSVEILEDRSLLSANITVLGTAAAGGYKFLNFNGPNAGTNAAAGSNENGISNSGRVVGFDIDNNGNLHNFTVNPLLSPKVQELNINGSTTAMALGVNLFGTVVGNDGNGNAFSLSNGNVHTFIPLGGSAATAFGINDLGQIVGQYTDGDETPGFILPNPHTAIRIDAPSGPDIVNAQGINNLGLVVGFYVGTDGQDHGFIAHEYDARSGELTGTAVADPTIPAVPGEPGATFVFSQILGINDEGIAVGYYGDLTTSQHGFIYNTHTGQYTFLDDPSEAFDNGVGVTQITGIHDFGQITGFYSDANGVFHSFEATPSVLAFLHESMGLTTALNSDPIVANGVAASVNMPTTGLPSMTVEPPSTGQLVGTRQLDSGTAGAALSVGVSQVGKNVSIAPVDDNRNDVELWQLGQQESVPARLLLQ